MKRKTFQRKGTEEKEKQQGALLPKAVRPRQPSPLLLVCLLEPKAFFSRHAPTIEPPLKWLERPQQEQPIYA
jgi:hypothetical protein